MKFQPNRCLKYNTIVSEEEEGESSCSLSDHCGQLHIMDDEHADQASPSSNSNTPPEIVNGILHSDETSRSPSGHNSKAKPEEKLNQQPILLKKRGEDVAQLAVERVVNGFGDHSINKKHTQITQLPEVEESSGTIEQGQNIPQPKKPDSITGSTYQLPPSPEQNNKNNTTIANSTTTNNSTTIPNHSAINSTNGTAIALVNSGTYITPPQSPNCDTKLADNGNQNNGNQNNGNVQISGNFEPNLVQNVIKSPENIQQSTPTKRTLKIAPKLSFSKTREIKRLQKQHDSSNAKSVQFHLKRSYQKKSVGVQSENVTDLPMPGSMPVPTLVSTSSPHLFSNKHHLQTSAFKIHAQTKPESNNKHEVQKFHPLYKILPPLARPEIKLCKSQLFQQRQEFLAESDINSMVKNGTRSVQSHEEIMKMYDETLTSSDSENNGPNNLENMDNQKIQTLKAFQNSTLDNLNFDTLADSLQNALNIQKHRYLHKHDVMKMVPRRELFPKRMLEPGTTDKIIPTKLEDAFTEKNVKRAAFIQANSVHGNTAKVLWQGLSSFTSKDDLQAAFRFAEDESQRMKHGGNGLVPDLGFNRIFGGSRGSDGAVIEKSPKHSKNTGLKVGGSNKRGRDGNPRGFPKNHKLERLRVKEIMTPEYNKISSTVPSISSSRFSGNSVQNLNSPPVIELGNKTSSSFSVLFGQNSHILQNSDNTKNSSSNSNNQHFTQTPNLHHSTKFLPESRKRELLNSRVYEKNHETPKNEERKRIFAFHDCNSNPSTRKGGGGGGSVARTGVANSLPDFITARQTEPSIQFFTKSGKLQNNFEESSLYMRGRHRLDLDDTNGYRKPNFPVSLLERKTLKIVGLQEKKEHMSSSKKRVLSDFSSSEEEDDQDFTDSRDEVVHQPKHRHKRSRKLSERKLLSLEQEKQTSSRRKTIAGGEETNRGNKRGHKPEQKQKRVWKLSQSDNIPKDKLILKFKHRKKD